MESGRQKPLDTTNTLIDSPDDYNISSWLVTKMSRFDAAGDFMVAVDFCGTRWKQNAQPANIPGQLRSAFRLTVVWRSGSQL